MMADGGLERLVEAFDDSIRYMYDSRKKTIYVISIGISEYALRRSYDVKLSDYLSILDDRAAREQFISLVNDRAERRWKRGSPDYADKFPLCESFTILIGDRSALEISREGIKTVTCQRIPSTANSDS